MVALLFPDNRSLPWFRAVPAGPLSYSLRSGSWQTATRLSVCNPAFISPSESQFLPGSFQDPGTTLLSTLHEPLLSLVKIASCSLVACLAHDVWFLLVCVDSVGRLRLQIWKPWPEEGGRHGLILNLHRKVVVNYSAVWWLIAYNAHRKFYGISWVQECNYVWVAQHTRNFETWGGWY